MTTAHSHEQPHPVPTVTRAPLPAVDVSVPTAPVYLSARQGGPTTRGRPAPEALPPRDPVRRTAQDLLRAVDGAPVRRMLGGPEVEDVSGTGSSDVVALSVDAVRQAVVAAGLESSGAGGDCDRATTKALSRLAPLLRGTVVGRRGILFWRRAPDDESDGAPDYPGHTLQDHVAVLVGSGPHQYVVDTTITQFREVASDLVQGGIFVGPPAEWQRLLVALGDHAVVEVADKYLGGMHQWDVLSGFLAPPPPVSTAPSPSTVGHVVGEPKPGCGCGGCTIL